MKIYTCTALISIGLGVLFTGTVSAQEPLAQSAQAEQQSSELTGKELETMANAVKVKAVKDRGDGEYAAAVAGVQNFLDQYGSRLRVDYRVWLNVIMSEHMRLAGSWDPALALIQEYKPYLDQADSYQNSLLCSLLVTEARLHLHLGQIDRAGASVREIGLCLERMNAGSTGPEDYDLRGSLTARALLYSATSDYDFLEETMADVMRDPDLWEENQADLQRLMQVDVLARLAQAKGGVGALGDLVGELESFCTDESIGSEYRVLPALEVVNHLLGTEDLTGARKYVDLALDLMDQPAGGAPENQRSYAASLGARLARAEGASTETLIVIQADLRERVMQMFTRIRERELRIDGYGYFHHGEGRGLLSELIDVTLAVGKKDAKAEALSYLLAAQDCGVLGRYMKWPGADLAAIQEHLIAGDQEHAILVYFPVDWGTHLFMIDAQGVAHFSLEGAGPIEESQQALSVWIGPPTGSFVDLRKRQQATCMKQLAGQLLPSEVLKRLAPITRVTIVHSGLLANLPFEALPMQGTTLGAAKAICYAPSLSVALGLDARQKAKRAERPGPRFQVAFVGAPESEEALAAGRSQIDLPEEFKEAWQVPFHGRVQVHLGASASAENTKSAFATATMAQIFAHGGSDLKEGDPALIYLATGPSSEDGILRPGAMEGWLTPPLVVITACGSGRGATRRGEAPANDFAGTLFRHNTSCVVESAYSIDIEVARRLTLTLNKAVASGLSPAEGMRQLRAELAQENAFDDLYYLSLIRVVGAGHASFF